MKSIVPPVKGTRDYYPEIMGVRSWLYQKIREVSEKFGYQEYEGPFLERIDLYAAKSGDELVKEQSFVFEDRGGDRITLRPELTPTLARMVAQKQNELIYPLHWWSFGPFWRYERPQKGRTREFFQWNIDIIGANSAEADAELVAICAEFFKAVGLSPKEVNIQVNNRRLMDAELTRLGFDSGQKKTVLHLIDRKDKMGPAEWEAYGLSKGVSIEQLNGIKNLLATPDLWEDSDELRRVFNILDGMGLRDYVRYSPQIIRGLDYYTGVVFEAKDLDGGRSILGGGHYDNLVEAVGGSPLPAVGFAMGDLMISLVLEKYGKLPAFQTVPAQVLVTVFDAEHLPSSFSLAAALRNAGLKTIVYPEASKLPKQLKYADRIGVRFVIIEGPDEEAAGKVTIKDLSRHDQVSVAKGDAAAALLRLLAQG